MGMRRDGGGITMGSPPFLIPEVRMGQAAKKS